MTTSGAPATVWMDQARSLLDRLADTQAEAGPLRETLAGARAGIAQLLLDLRVVPALGARGEVRRTAEPLAARCAGRHRFRAQTRHRLRDVGP